MPNKIFTIQNAPFPIEVDEVFFNSNPSLYAGLTEVVEEDELAQIEIRITFVPPPSLIP